MPATIACARSGDLARAHHYLGIAERSAKLWEGTAWEAALTEARAHLAVAERDGRALPLFAAAADQFARSGQPLDTARCRQFARTTPPCAESTG